MGRWRSVRSFARLIYFSEDVRSPMDCERSSPTGRMLTGGVVLTNRVSFLGSYLFNWALSRVRCYIEVCGSEAELDAASDVLVGLGWRSCFSVRLDSIDGRNSFVRDVRGTMSTQTEVELVNKLNQRLTDACCTARISAVALAPIQYPSLVVDSAVLPRQGLVIGGMQADRFSEVSYPDNHAVDENSNSRQDDGGDPAAEGDPVGSVHWTVLLGHGVYGAIDNWLVRHLSPRLERWLLSDSEAGDSPILRKSLLLWDS